MKQFIYRINGQDYIVAVNKLENSIAQVAVNGSNYEVELVSNDEEVTLVSRPVAKATAAPAAAPKTATVSAAPSAPAKSGAGSVKSPLPGIVVAINVNVGDEVKKGQTVAVLEAMKMENAILSPANATIKEILVKKGETVEKNKLLIELE